MNTVRRPTWIEIDLNQIKRNFISLRKFLKRNVRIIAVVKADAYGHGAVPVAKCLEKIGADVPFFINGGIKQISGMGEVITDISRRALLVAPKKVDIIILLFLGLL